MEEDEDESFAGLLYSMSNEKLNVKLNMPCLTLQTWKKMRHTLEYIFLLTDGNFVFFLLNFLSFFFHYLGHAFLREWLLPLKLFSLEPFTWFRSLCLGLPGCHITPVILLSLYCDCISPIFPHDVTNWMKKFLHPRLASKHWKSILSVTLKWKWLRTIIFFLLLWVSFASFIHA